MYYFLKFMEIFSVHQSEFIVHNQHHYEDIQYSNATWFTTQHEVSTVKVECLKTPYWSWTHQYSFLDWMTLEFLRPSCKLQCTFCLPYEACEWNFFDLTQFDLWDWSQAIICDNMKVSIYESECNFVAIFKLRCKGTTRLKPHCFNQCLWLGFISDYHTMLKYLNFGMHKQNSSQRN